MNTIINSFDTDNYYVGSSQMPYGASGVNTKVATLTPLPVFNPQTHRAKWLGDSWSVETLPVVEAPTPPEELPVTPSFPRFYGNDKLDQLFTGTEQIAVAGKSSSDAEVALTFYRMINSNYMSYEDPETEVGLSLLESKGLLTEERKAQIVEQMQPR